MTQSPYDIGWEFASTRSQVETDRIVIAMDCGEQAATLYLGEGEDDVVDQEAYVEFGHGALDFLHDRPHRDSPSRPG